MDILADLPFQHDDDGNLLPIRTCAIYAWCLMSNHFHLLVRDFIIEQCGTRSVAEFQRLSLEEQTRIVLDAKAEGASIRQVMSHTGWS